MLSTIVVLYTLGLNESGDKMPYDIVSLLPELLWELGRMIPLSDAMKHHKGQIVLPEYYKLTQ